MIVEKKKINQKVQEFLNIYKINISKKIFFTILIFLSCFYVRFYYSNQIYIIEIGKMKQCYILLYIINIKEIQLK